jgi:hypothetical protein
MRTKPEVRHGGCARTGSGRRRRELIRPTGKWFDRFFRVHVAHTVENSAPARARKNQFRERNHADLGCPDRRRKILCFLKIRNHWHPAASRASQEGGASRSSRTLARDAMDAVTRKTGDVTRVRQSRVGLTPRRWRQVGGRNSADDGGKRARSPRRARNKVGSLRLAHPTC